MPPTKRLWRCCALVQDGTLLDGRKVLCITEAQTQRIRGQPPDTSTGQHSTTRATTQGHLHEEAGPIDWMLPCDISRSNGRCGTGDGGL